MNSKYAPKGPTGPGTCEYLSLEEARQCYRAVSERTGIAVDALLGDGRERQLVRARWLVMREMRDRKASYNMIAKRMQMDHASVINGLNRLEELGIAA